ncbi:MAG: MgtC/SapB family protein [Clostridia bacterium]|nr:MgtC/SapB family protein [Clostridia bacterium]MBQ4575384.1 MgtC/SapB family protein [Clostridia bacterium]
MLFTLSDPIAALLGSWSTVLTPASILFRIGIALIYAAVLGCERSSKRHAAGLRTFIIVALATCISMLLDIASGGAAPILSAAAIVGLSIISVNSTLYSSRSQIKGLTTSVGLWACGIVGLTVGAGLYTVTAVCFAALFFTLWLFPAFEVYLKNRSNHFEVHLELVNSRYLQNFVTTIRELGMKIDDIESNPAYHGSGLSVYSISISIIGRELKQYKTHKEIIEALSTLEYIYHIEEM